MKTIDILKKNIEDMKQDREEILKSRGFKRKWLSDLSGFWYSKRVKVLDFNLIFDYDLDFDKNKAGEITMITNNFYSPYVTIYSGNLANLLRKLKLYES